MAALVGLLAFGMIPPARPSVQQLATSTAQYTLVSLELDPDRVAGGRPVTGTVRLNLPAPAGGLTVSLMSADPLLAQTPPTVTIPVGSAAAAFPITTRAVTAAAPVILTASFGGVIQAATLVVAPSILDLGSDQIQVVPLPTSDIVYDPFNRRIWASVPGSAGRGGNSVVPIDPETGAVGASAAPHAAPPVTPVGLSLTIQPARVIGGRTPAGTVLLTRPAPAGGITIALSSERPETAAVPSTVTVAAGTRAAVFPIRTTRTSATLTVRITASFGVSSAAPGLTITRR